MPLISRFKLLSASVFRVGRIWLPLPLLAAGCMLQPPGQSVVTAGLTIGPIDSAASPAIAPPHPTPAAPGGGSPTSGPTPTSAPASGGGGTAPTSAPTPTPLGLGLCAEVADNAGIAATLAGGTYGYADGAYAIAQFRSPRGMAIDATGQLYVADTGNRAVRRLALDGTVSTLAGGPEQAILQEPYGLAVSAAGEVFVSDTARHAIYRIGPDGTVTLLAGGTQPGLTDGTGANAQFDDPRGLTLDAAGNLFVADMNNHCIRKVTPAGVVSTFAGSAAMGAADGTGAAATFTSPIALAFGSDGDLFVADIVTHSLRKISPAGVVTTFAGGTSGDVDGLGTAARFAHPWAIASDALGTLYVVDGEQASRIRRIGPDAQVTTLAGASAPGYQNGSGAQARFFSAFALTASSCGRLYLTDGFCRVREVR